MSNTRQAYVELNFKETSRSGDCNLLEWNESEAVLKDVKPLMGVFLLPCRT